MHRADAKEREVKYDYTNMLSGAVGEHGVSDEELDALSGRFEEVFATLTRQRGDGILGFMDLPYDETTLGAVLKMAASVDEGIENLVVLGIGGSALGTIALKGALCHPLHNMLDRQGRGGRPRLFVLDNIDPNLIGAVLEFLEPEKTLFNVITKSGGTAETVSQLMLFWDHVSKALGQRASDHFVATTDPEKGQLRRMAGEFGWRTLPVAPNVGGRFSVLTPVGLFPAAVVGIDVKQLLSGAAMMDRRCEAGSVRGNPALAYAALQYLLYAKGVNVSVLMPYASALLDLADWYRQLWAESLGKKLSTSGEEIFVGPTPVKALGATDQHSQVQLYVEGPYDKSITFIEVEQFGRSVTIPETFSEYDAAGYLGGRTLNELLATERRGSEVALVSAGRPNGTIRMPAVDAFTVGQVLYMLEMATAISGALYRINAFDQPGVEAGKVAAYALMGRGGYEDKKGQIEDFLRRPRRVV